VIHLILLISYDLNQHERPQAYEDVRSLIETHAIEARKALYSQWFVFTQELPDAWSERIGTVADKNDSWFVVQVQRPYQGWLDKELWPWLADRV
jgi:hypothetical protein